MTKVRSLLLNLVVPHPKSLLRSIVVWSTLSLILAGVVTAEDAELEPDAATALAVATGPVREAKDDVIILSPMSFADPDFEWITATGDHALGFVDYDGFTQVYLGIRVGVVPVSAPILVGLIGTAFALILAAGCHYRPCRSRNDRAS